MELENEEYNVIIYYFLLMSEEFFYMADSSYRLSYLL